MTVRSFVALVMSRQPRSKTRAQPLAESRFMTSPSGTQYLGIGSKLLSVFSDKVTSRVSASS